jgi:succinate dehydrogenase / fumarate reductase iron-sulfur subunit
MNFTLHVWRQEKSSNKGEFKIYEVSNIDADTSILELLDELNIELIEKGEDAIVFDHDCREGICGSCALVINGHPHGKRKATTTCQTYMRDYADQRELWIEPWRAESFPVIKDLSVDRSAFDRIIQSGGYISVHTGSAPDANSILVEKNNSDQAFDAANCIGCGACVAVCPNSSATLFVGAKVAHLDWLPQGNIESKERAKNMSQTMINEGFGMCSNQRFCSKACPKEISLKVIQKLNKIVR